MRESEVNRKTLETNINLKVLIEGNGEFSGTTTIGFFDHMLELFARHANINLNVEVAGDVQVDFHHTVEDIGITLGQALKEALGDKSGTERYGFVYLPMDEALVRVCLDLSGRSYLVYNVELAAEKVGDFDVELVEEFMKALANNADMTMHFELLYGKNTHHIIEGVFKGLGQALKRAAKTTCAEGEVLSTKGSL